MGKSPTELRAYVDGPDAITGRPFMHEVIDAIEAAVHRRASRVVSVSTV